MPELPEDAESDPVFGPYIEFDWRESLPAEDKKRLHAEWRDDIVTAIKALEVRACGRGLEGRAGQAWQTTWQGVRERVSMALKQPCTAEARAQLNPCAAQEGDCNLGRRMVATLKLFLADRCGARWVVRSRPTRAL